MGFSPHRCHGQSVVTPVFGIFLIFWGITQHPGSTFLVNAYLIAVGTLLPIWSYVSYHLIKRTVPNAKRYLVTLGLCLCLLYGGVLIISSQNIMTNSYNLTATIVAGLSLIETLAFTVVVYVCQANDSTTTINNPANLFLVRDQPDLHHYV